MRRTATVVLLAAATCAAEGTARATPWTVTLEGGAEADSNVQRIESSSGIERITAGVARLGAKVGHKDRFAGGAYAMVASVLTRLVASDEAASENVALLTGELRYLRPLVKRPVSVGLGVIAADAQPVSTEVGARSFRNLGADALLALDGGDGKQLTLAAGARAFVYKADPMRQFDWTGPVASARLDLTLWQPSGSARSLELATYVAFEAREYDATALAEACPPGASPIDDCSRGAGTSITRRDRVQRFGAELTWTSSIVAAAGYQLLVVDSNSYGQSLTRHRATISATRSLPWRWFGTALATLQIDRYPDGLRIKTDNQQREFTSLDDENRSSLQLRLARQIDDRWSFEIRAAIWRNLGGTPDAEFRRESIYGGLVYSR